MPPGLVKDDNPLMPQFWQILNHGGLLITTQWQNEEAESLMLQSHGAKVLDQIGISQLHPMYKK